MATRKKSAARIKARVLVDVPMADGVFLPCNSIAELDAAVAIVMQSDGLVDTNPEAVAAAALSGDTHGEK